MKNTRLVYSTDGARSESTNLRAGARPATPPSDDRGDGVVRIFRERAGRNGKIVTVIRGLPDGPSLALDATATELRRLCGAGGTVKNRAVEIQGDHRERVAAHLRGLGYKVKLAGG